MEAERIANIAHCNTVNTEPFKYEQAKTKKEKKVADKYIYASTQRMRLVTWSESGNSDLFLH